MIIVLTICSSNYLAHAKTLGESLSEHNPEYQFVIGLVDRISAELTPDYLHPFEVIPVEQLGIAQLREMVQKYDIVELNTAVKPFYIEYLYRRDANVTSVVYLDPDILVLGSLQPMVDRLNDNSFVLTPHSCTYDHTPANVYYERAMLRTGVFNLGFLATSRTRDTFAFLDWWQKRLIDYCYARFRDGLFVDQLWAILALVYVRKVWIETGPGYNMCYWNLFERSLSVENGRYVVNGREPLIFYHFSSYKPTAPDVIVTRGEQPVPSFSDRADLKPLFNEYQTRLLRNGYARVRSLPCYFDTKTRADGNIGRDRNLKTIIRDVLKSSLVALPKVVRKPLRSLAWFIVSYAPSDEAN